MTANFKNERWLEIGLILIIKLKLVLKIRALNQNAKQVNRSASIYLFIKIIKMLKITCTLFFAKSIKVISYSISISIVIMNHFAIWFVFYKNHSLWKENNYPYIFLLFLLLYLCHNHDLRFCFCEILY